MSNMTTRAGYLLGAGLLLLFILVCAGAFWAVHAAQASRIWLTHTHEIIDKTKNLLVDTLNAEANQRGYLITGDAQYVQPYERAAERITATLSQLRELASDNPIHLRSLDELSGLLEGKIEELSQGIRNFSADTPVRVIDIDQDSLTKISAALTAMTTEEERVFQNRVAEIARQQKVAHTLITLGAVLAVALIGFGLWNLRTGHILRRRAENTVAATAAELTASFNSLSQGVAVFDENQRLVRWNSGWLTFIKPFGDSITAGVNYSNLTNLIEPGLLETAEEVSRNSVSSEPFVCERTRADGEIFELRRTALPGGGFVLTSANITQRMRIAQAMKETERLQTIGQLTGAVAHDFNNHLTIILGNLDIAQRRNSDPQVGIRLAAAIEGAQRSAELTRQLLSFGRRQALEPVPTNVNDLATRMRDLLRRSLSHDIDIDVIEYPELWVAMVDPAHLENAILNLALNARDAMPGGGKLTIKTANVSLDESAADEIEPGNYVLITITDTGTGISPDVLAHCFEPFYTTKGNKGTGLGLSSVHGFVSQSNGRIKISSRLGDGTAIYLYIPKCDQLDCNGQEENGLYQDKIDRSENDDRVVRFA
jgi:signal transduction histidine kinase/CHASE3 domain sensor protein